MRTRLVAMVVIVLSIIGELVGWRAACSFDLDLEYQGTVIHSPWYEHAAQSPLLGVGLPLATAAFAMWLGSRDRPRLAWIALAAFSLLGAATMLFLGEMI